ncbi:outer membrane protein assembly factor BamB [Xanthomonas sp. LMG 8992]|uniref:outer membrane protein assembly factor BamB n=1 Tax=Xanthomonas sp. LMG 8992 TaxID=1591157 RepID=UPI001369B6F6|nr:outer membrane protein assembly factor BamB [Xanthomonas sp. LMG 8992]MXV11378.1 outer membrane protein assembly factor BamB [Xanthomonas sp. LMG 8992]
MKVVMFKRVAIVALLGLALSGCTTVKGWFAGKDAAAKKAAEPAELVKFTPSVKVVKLWSTDAGKGERRIGVRQHPVVADGKVYAAATSGTVYALDLQTGKTVWEYDAKQARKQQLSQAEDQPKSQVESESGKNLSKDERAAYKQRLRNEKQQAKERKRLEKKRPLPRFAGGPGVGDGLVVVGALDGEVIALDAATGTEKWRAKVPNEVIAAPVIAQNMVFVRSNDGRTTAFDAATGQQRWFNAQELPSLTVRGNAPVVAGPGVLFIGNDDGTLAALAMQDGRVLWEQTIGVPEGRTELERMADVDGAPVLDGTTLYASSFKNETVALEGPSGRPLWNRDHGGAGGIGVSSGNVVVADNAGTVWALDKASGSAMWSQPALARRSLTGVAIQGDYAVVGDYKGYLHWLRLDNGEFAARERVGRQPLVAQPVVADGILLMQNTKGDLTAFRLGQ